MSPKVKCDSKCRKINEALPNLLRILAEHKIIRLNDRGIIEILSNELFNKLGYILFLLHLGCKINDKKKEGYFHFIAVNADKVFVLKYYNLAKDNDFWLFYRDNFVYLQENLLLQKLINELSRQLIQKKDIFSSEEVKRLINDYIENPVNLIDPKYEIIDIVEFPVQLIINILKSIDEIGVQIDFFQVFLYFYFKSKMEFVYLESYFKDFENENTWDLVAYDKEISKSAFLVEITTGHPEERILGKFPSFLESIEKNCYTVYITPKETANKGTYEFLNYLGNNHSNLTIINSYVPMEPEDINKGIKTRECYNKIINELNKTIESARKIS